MRIPYLLLALTLSACVDSTPATQPGTPTGTETPATPPLEGSPSWPKVPSGTAWALDGNQSKVGFVGRKITGKHTGGFKVLTGTAIIEDGAIVGATIDIDMKSTWADRPKLTKHLKSPDFFDVPQHPTARFATAEIRAGSSGAAMTHTITGVLELRGVLGNVRAPATIRVADGVASVRATFEIDRQQWGVSYPGKPDNLIQDDVEIRLNLKFNKPAG